MTAIDQNHRAGNLWPILVATARKNPPSITYGDAAALLGIHHRAMQFVLDRIQKHCLVEGYPRLTALVVSKSTGLPGGGFAGVPGDQEDIADVLQFRWDSIENPFSLRSDVELTKISNQLLKDPDGEVDRYYLTLSRGDQQRVFRRAVMKAYRYKCAICGAEYAAVLQAAHIVPWSDKRRKLRIDPRNGIAMCANHHALFDAKIFDIDEKYRVQLRGSSGRRNLSDSDAYLTTQFATRPIELPLDRALRPKKALLRERCNTR